MLHSDRTRKLLGDAWRVAGLSLILCAMWAQVAWCQSDASLPLGMPQQMREALQIIIPCPTPNNAVLIDDQQRSNMQDLPGRLIVLKGSPYIPATSLMQNYRRKDAPVKTEVGPAKPPVRSTQLELSDERSLSFLTSWFGFSVKNSRKCLVELKATPTPSASMSSNDLNIDLVKAELIDKLPLEKRLCLGIILSVTPYEVMGSLGTLESKPATLGVWYLKMGRDWYRKSEDEQRLYYLVAVYVPPITPEEALASLLPGVVPERTGNASATSLVDEKTLAAWVEKNSESLPKFGVVRELPTVAMEDGNKIEQY